MSVKLRLIPQQIGCHLASLHAVFGSKGPKWFFLGGLQSAKKFSIGTFEVDRDHIISAKKQTYELGLASIPDILVSTTEFLHIYNIHRYDDCIID